MFGTRGSNRLLAALGVTVAAVIALAAAGSLLGRTLASPRRAAALVSLGLAVGALAAVVAYSVSRPDHPTQ